MTRPNLDLEVILIDMIVAKNVSCTAGRGNIYARARLVMARLLQSRPNISAEHTMAELDAAITTVEAAFLADQARRLD